MKYYVPINTAEEREDGRPGTITMDCVIVAGPPKRRFKAFMRYLAVRLGTHDYHTRINVIRELGFTDLLSWR